MNKNEWIYVEDDLPEIQKGMTSVSIDVTVETDDGKQHTGFYLHDGCQWYIYIRTGVQEADVTRWALIGGRNTMNKKMKLVLDILQLAVEISKNTKTDVFVNYSGHVDLLNVMIFYSGCSYGRDADYEKDIYLDTNDHRTEEDIIEILDEIYAELAKYKEGLK